ncbi:cysteine--tRNA ligase [bacterium]|nr:cysteine--tRNA ligase [bacterium]
MLKFFNTYSGRIEDFIPIEQGKAKMYTCGPTVYDYVHIGNLRAYLFEDILRRTLKFFGFDVTQVMNLTDVDDKTIREANAKGMSLKDYTEKYKKAFFEDIDTLRIERAEEYPSATKHISQMVNIIKALIKKGCTYEKSGSIYFKISEFQKYGRLSKIDIDRTKTGLRVDLDEYDKDDVRDFALWKASKDGETSWDTDIGKGRPGWHIECSAMSMEYLGETFDIHTGGVDNIFPHHENEIAQSEMATGKKFVNYWLHNEHLLVDGKKMSKSLGNFYTLRDLLENGHTPQAIRFLLISVHYRKQLNFTDATMEKAENTIKRIRDFYKRLKEAKAANNSNDDLLPEIDNALESFKSEMADDLNISGSLGHYFELMKKINLKLEKGEVSQNEKSKALNFFHSAEKILDLEDREETILDVKLTRLIEKREIARQNKDFTKADEIRDQLLAHGIVLEDTKDGTRWKRL